MTAKMKDCGYCGDFGNPHSVLGCARCGRKRSRYPDPGPETRAEKAAGDKRSEKAWKDVIERVRVAFIARQKARTKVTRTKEPKLEAAKAAAHLADAAYREVAEERDRLRAWRSEQGTP